MFNISELCMKNSGPNLQRRPQPDHHDQSSYADRASQHPADRKYGTKKHHLHSADRDLPHTLSYPDQQSVSRAHALSRRHAQELRKTHHEYAYAVYNDFHREAADLRQWIQHRKKINKNSDQKNIILRADKSVPIENVVALMDVLNELNENFPEEERYKMVLATEAK